MATKTVELILHNGTLIETVSGLQLLTANSPKFKSADFGNAMGFNGSNQRAYAPNATIGDITTNDFSIECWVKFNNLTGAPTLISKKTSGNVGWTIYRNAGVVSMALADSGGTTIVSGGTVVIGVWYHVVCTFDRDGNGTVYINSIAGTPTSIATRTGTLTNAFTLSIGSTATPNDFTNCDVALVRQYDYVLTAKEVKEKYAEFLWNKQTGRKGYKKSNPIAYSEFKEERTNEANSTFAFTFKKGSLVDNSAVGANATKSGAMSIVEGYRLDGVDDTISLGARNATKTIAMRVKLKTTTEQIIELSNGGTLIHAAAGVLTSVDFATKYVQGIAGTALTAGVWTTIVLTSNAAVAISAGTIAKNIGNYGAFDIEEIRGYSDEKSATWAANYHNKFASRITARDTGFGEAVGNAPREWEGIGVTAGVPNVVWDELTSDNTILGLKKGYKLHKCNVDQNYSLPSTQAYGVWGGYISKGAGNPYIAIIANKKGNITGANGITGYELDIDVNNNIRFNLRTAGTLTTAIIATANNYVVNNNLYEWKITRTSVGLFTLYLKGGSYTTWQTVGSGTNNVITTSSCINNNLDANDKFKLLPCKNQVRV